MAEGLFFGGGGRRMRTTSSKESARVRAIARETPLNQLAADTLINELKKYPYISSDLAKNWSDEMINLEQLSTMNMDTLAATLIFLNQDDVRRNGINERTFNDEAIRRVFAGIRVKKVELSEVYTEIRHKAVLYRYIRMVLDFRAPS